MDLFERIQKLLPGMPGWCSFAKAKRMAEVILNARPAVCVEIGVFGGASLIPQAMALKLNGAGVVTGIDPWSNDAALEELIDRHHKDWWGKADLEAIYQRCQQQIAQTGVGGHCRLIRDRAENVAHQFADGSIDVLHIDGNHSELTSCRDVQTYLPKVREGGFIIFDDAWWNETADDGSNHRTTRKAVSLLSEACQEVETVEDCILFRKR